MSYINTHEMAHSTVFSIYADKSDILVCPEYQRSGDVWTLEKKQLLIDSIINRYDIPKIYFHKFDRKTSAKEGKEYAIIDGRQRLETIWQFIEGKFHLSDDFVYLKDENIDAKGVTYNDLGKKYPKIKNRFDSTSLPIILVETDDIELIEDMFSRLNEAVPLNAAEKRNAFGGDMVNAINEIAKKDFFTKKVKISNKRYQHKEIAVRLLFLEYSMRINDKIIDTKKVYLDKFTKDFKNGHKPEVKKTKGNISKVLKEMSKVFTSQDSQLSAQAYIPIYYMTFDYFMKSKNTKILTRDKFTKFNIQREKNRKKAEKDITKANFELLEYDRLTQHGTNDASSIRERFNILRNFLEKKK